jgi:hypothetical protein
MANGAHSVQKALAPFLHHATTVQGRGCSVASSLLVPPNPTGGLTCATGSGVIE